MLGQSFMKPLLYAFLIFGLVSFAQLKVALAQRPGSSFRSQVPETLDWQEVNTPDRVGTLQLLSAQTKSNYEQISTWAATYTVHVESYLSPDFVESSFSKRLPEGTTPALIESSEFTVEVAIDIEADYVFRDRDTTKFQLLRADSRNPLVIPETGPVDERSIVTPEHYVHFAYKRSPATYSVLPDHPKAQNTRAARRVQPEEARGKYLSMLIDPRRFFRASTPSMCWEELDMYVSMLSGKSGGEKQRIANDRLMVSKSVCDGKVWYKIQTHLSFPNGNDQLSTSIWSPLCGYNPVELAFTSKKSGEVRKLVRWKWQKVGEVWVPASVLHIFHPRDPGDVDTFRRYVVMNEYALNKPLSGNQFAYGALGLDNGDLVIDEINREVLVFEDGQTKRLAAFHEPYVPGGGGGRVWDWWIAGGGGLLVMLIILWRIRRG